MKATRRDFLYGLGATLGTVAFNALLRAEAKPAGHRTKPPARYTEAGLVQKLEELGIGRPSTYASIIGTILDREYAVKRGPALVPTPVAFAVVQLMERLAPTLVDYSFTA